MSDLMLLQGEWRQTLVDFLNWIIREIVILRYLVEYYILVPCQVTWVAGLQFLYLSVLYSLNDTDI